MPSNKVSHNFITSPLLHQQHISAIFTTRQGGISLPPFHSLNLGLNLGDSEAHVQHNLKLVCQQADIPIPHQCQQTHNTKIKYYSGMGISHSDDADILISQTVGTSLAVRTADCLPILLCDPQQHIIAAVHAGWRGSAKNIVQIAVKDMQKLGAKPESIMACLGPCIGTCCFEVDHHTAQQLAQSHPHAAQYIHTKGHHAYPDLQAINLLQLQAAGINIQHIESLKYCTCCLKQQFFSYRRDQLESGRQLAIISIA